MLSEFTVYDDDNFDPDDDYEYEDEDDEDAKKDSDYLENFVFTPDKEYMFRCREALAELRRELEQEGVRQNLIDSLFKEGLKILYASCWIDTYIDQDTTIFQRVLAILGDEVREREARTRIVEKRFEIE